MLNETIIEVEQSRQNFPKEARVLLRNDFSRILDTGCKQVCRELVVFATKSKKPRLGLIVSKKVGNAVIRNKVKRSLREIYRCFVLSNCPWEIVIIARPEAASCSFSALANSLQYSLRRLNNKLGKEI